MSRVVVTGVGWVGSHGAGRDALTAALAAGQPATVEVDRSAGHHRPSGARLAALVPAESLAPLVPAAAARRMSYPSRLAVAAMRLAFADAGLDEKSSPFDATGIVMATAFGPVRITEQMLDAILHRGPDQASPFHFTESVASAPASQMALACKALGPNVTITQREAGPLLALAEGARLVVTGRVGRALVGSVEEMSPLLHALLDRFRALALPQADGRERPRPFDRDRTGLLAAEGATVLVLESEPTAAARGARPLAVVDAAWGGFDPTAPPLSWGQGIAPLAEGLARGLARHGIDTASLDRIVSGASGARRGDRLEAAVLHRALGETLPPVLAPKGTTGEFSGGALAAAVLALDGNADWPTAGFANADPALGLAPHDGSALAPARRILASSLASGGSAAWAVLSRP